MGLRKERQEAAGKLRTIEIDRINDKTRANLTVESNEVVGLRRELAVIEGKLQSVTNALAVKERELSSRNALYDHVVKERENLSERLQQMAKQTITSSPIHATLPCKNC